MTGADVKIEFDRQIFKAYSTYYNPVKMNGLLKKAMILSIQEKYDDLTRQSQYDDITSVIRLNKVFLVNNNQIYTAPITIQNVVKLGNNFIITTTKPHNISVGDSVSLSGILGFAPSASVNTTHITTSFNHTSTIFTVNIGGIAGVYTGGGHVVGVSLNGFDKMAADYNHLLTLRARYEQGLGLVVTDVTSSQPIQIKVDTINNNIVDGDYINISGVLNNTNANGDRYVKKINRKTFALYYDKDLLNPVSSNGNYQGVPVIKRLYYNYATPNISIEKISNYDAPSPLKPQFERGDVMIKITPYDYSCNEIQMDYITNATVYIDVNNSILDLEDTYSIDFLHFVIEKGVQLYSSEVNDQDRYKTSSIELQGNQ